MAHSVHSVHSVAHCGTLGHSVAPCVAHLGLLLHRYGLVALPDENEKVLVKPGPPHLHIILLSDFLKFASLQADSGQLYSSAMQGLSSYANNIMGHTMNQYAAQSSLLSTQVLITTSA